MNAKEMFEALGFTQTETNERYIIFVHTGNHKSETIWLMFWLKFKSYEPYFPNDDDGVDYSREISVPLHLDITQQMKELGWIE